MNYDKRKNGGNRRDKASIFQQSCLVCGCVTREFHFGAVCCVACGAFFRRAVAEGREFSCGRNGNCVVGGTSRSTCRGCRYNKCVSVGMDPDAVQSGRQSKGQSPAPSSCHEGGCHSQNDEQSDHSQSTSHSQQAKEDIASPLQFFETNSEICNTAGVRNSVENFHSAYQYLKESRKLFYSNGNLRNLIDGQKPEARKVGLFFHFRNDGLRTEVSFMLQMIRVCAKYNNLTTPVKEILFKNYALLMLVLERHFITSQMDPEGGKVYHCDETYVDLNDCMYEVPKEAAELGLDTLNRLFLTPWKEHLAMLARPMREMRFSEVDLVALLHWALFDSDLPGIDPTQRLDVDRARSRVYQDWFEYYAMNGVAEGQLRIAHCINLLYTANDIVQHWKENFHLMRVFKLCEYDDIVCEIFGRTPLPEERMDVTEGIARPNSHGQVLQEL